MLWLLLLCTKFAFSTAFCLSLAAFAVLGCRLVGAVSAVLGDEGVVEAVRLFFSEIEYSESNLYALLELLAEKA